MSYYWKPYVNSAEKLRKAGQKLEKMMKGGPAFEPVRIEGKTIAKTFWGKAWCANLERYSDFENRLPRGRSYARNGSVVDLRIGRGTVAAVVRGSDIYNIEVTIGAVQPARWKAIRKDCAGAIDSLVELLQGRLSTAVMERICRPKTGLFPAPAELKFACNCPDWASMCKHVAAVFYGIGARLDERPELLFQLRQVDEKELIAKVVELPMHKAGASSKKMLATDDLSSLFGLEMDTAEAPVPTPEVPEKPVRRTAAKKKSARPSVLATERQLASKPAAKKRLRPDGPGAAAKKTVGTKATAKGLSTAGKGKHKNPTSRS